ncbi:MAG: ethylbenzene dehydrogenase-related protein [Anaerolineae bacterium]
MTKKITLFVFTAILVASLVSLIFAQGATLTAVKVAAGPALDGIATDAAWSAATALAVPVSGGKIGNVDVTLKAVYDDSNIYMLLQWADSTLSIDKNLWEYDGSSWSKSGNEDRFSILWDLGVTGFTEQSCLVLCHADGMRTNADGEFADEWHWKAARSNPMGYSDDKYVDNTYEEGDVEAGHHGDGGDSTYANNKNEAGDGPAYTWAGTPSTPLGVPAELASHFLLDSEKAEITAPASGDKVPGYLLSNPSGSRGDVKAYGVWADGTWTVEVQRALDTGANASKDGAKVDQVFAPGGTYHFGLAIMDDTGSNHSFAASPIALTLSTEAAAAPVTGGVPFPLAAVAIAGGLVIIGAGLVLRWRRR